MNEQHSFTTQQIVWARVQHYPWWPAKITNSRRQNSKTVYKLKFFGDSSSCYLHSDSIAQFIRFDVDQQLHNCKDLKLKKAIQLAKLLFSKEQTQNSTDKSQQLKAKKVISQTPITQEQTQIESKGHSCLLQKMIIEKPVNSLESSFKEYIQTEVTPDNVLSVLEGYSTAKKNVLRGSLNRKQLISFESNLKQKLLLKYNLNFHLQNQFTLKQNSIVIQKKVHYTKRKFIAKLKKKSDASQVSCKKLYSILKEKIESTLSKRLSLDIFRKLEKEASGNKDVFCNSYLKIVRKLSSMSIIPHEINDIFSQNEGQNESKSSNEQTLSTETQTSKCPFLQS